MTKSKFQDFAKNFLYSEVGPQLSDKPVTWLLFIETAELMLRRMEHEIALAGQETQILRRIMNVRNVTYVQGATFKKGSIIHVGTDFFIAMKCTAAPLDDSTEWWKIDDISPLPDLPPAKSYAPRRAPAPPPAPVKRAASKRIIQRTRVTGHDSQGRITEFEKEEIQVDADADAEGVGKTGAVAGEHADAAAS